MSSAAVKRWLAFSCVHAPLHDGAAVDFLLEQIREHRPDLIVNLGDLFEADSASRWPSEYEFTLVEEYQAADRILREVRHAAPDGCEFWFLPGNHCDNILSPNRVPRDLRDLVDWRTPKHAPDGSLVNGELLRFWKRKAHYEFDARRGTARLGQVVFAHGYRSDKFADRKQAVQFCKDWGLYVGGHTHKPKPVTQVEQPGNGLLPKWFANTGCLRDMNAEYVKRKDTHEWGQAVVVGTAVVKPGIERYQSRKWGAETRVFRMNDGSDNTHWNLREVPS